MNILFKKCILTFTFYPKFFVYLNTGLNAITFQNAWTGHLVCFASTTVTVTTLGTCVTNAPASAALAAHLVGRGTTAKQVAFRFSYSLGKIVPCNHPDSSCDAEIMLGV